MTISLSGLKPFLMSLFIASLLTACSSAPTSSNSGSPSSAPAASSSSSGEAFEGLITSKMNAGSQAMEIKYAIKGSRSRIETQLSAGGTQMGVMLMDFASGSQTMLMPQTKTYMNLNMAEKIAESVEKAGGDYFKATPTGKTETVAGYSCTHWILGEKQDTDACLAKGLGYFGGGGESDGIFGKLKNIALGDKTKAQLQANPEFLKFVEGGVFPLKLATIENGQPRTIMEVTQVERKSLEDSLFAIPSDYKKMEIPGMPGGKK